ncbi:MAG: peptidoglycan recognition protein family protein [Lachnospiraceae bacterium]|nr:peptidoglycan recognition protein family protein [Lachnospiraceae bacterium]
MNEDEKDERATLAPDYNVQDYNVLDYNILEPVIDKTTAQSNTTEQNENCQNELNSVSKIAPKDSDTTSASRNRNDWHARRIAQLRRRITVAAVAGLALLCLFVRIFHDNSTIAPVALLDKDWITVSLLPENPYSRPGIALTKINAIVVHYVGNAGTTAEQNRSYFAGLATSGTTYASSHFIVGMDGEVIQCVPMDEIAYCSNDRNYDTLSIECCHPYEDGAFTSETYSSLIRLLRTLCQMYDLDEDDIIRHYDVTGKACPLYYVNHEDAWEQLKADVFDPSFTF